MCKDEEEQEKYMMNFRKEVTIVKWSLHDKQN